MIFERKIYKKLLSWKNQTQGKKALLIEGARRTGKSTICEEFAKREYKSYILIDFAMNDSEVRSYFERYLNDLDTFFLLLQTHFGKKLHQRESLIIFDEVQRFPRAREAVKYLVKDGRYDYLETGSLISIKENVKDIVIPSEERHIQMHPLDFEEFATACGHEMLLSCIRDAFDERKEMERSLHNQAMQLFKEYILVGGMPKVLDVYLTGHKDFAAADLEKRDILSLYREDIMKIDSRYRSKVLSVYDQIPGFLSTHEKRVVFNRMQKGSYTESYEESFFWLSDSMISNECFLCSDPNVGLSLNEKRSYLKCYLADTGLLLSHAFDENELLEGKIYKQIMEEKIFVNEGMFYENVIAQMLVANGHKLYFYTHYNEDKHRNDMEVDFILSNKSKMNFKIYPVEVKSGKKYSTVSLCRFIEKYKKRIGGSYIIHPRNLNVKEDIVCIPPYMTMLL